MSGRIRTVKPEWLDDERMAYASDAARVLSIGLFLLADDYGNGRAKLMQLATKVWPLSGESPAELKSISRKAQKALQDLVKMRFLVLYEVDGQHYFAIRNWKKHQKVQHPGKPHVPGPPESLMSSSVDSQETLTPDQRPTTNDQDQGPLGDSQEGSKEPKQKRPSRIRDDWQISDRLREWCRQQGMSDRQVDQHRDRFVDFWASEGKTKVDWGRTFMGRIRSWIEDGRIVPERSAARTNPARPRPPRDHSADLAAERERRAREREKREQAAAARQSPAPADPRGAA